MEIKALVRGDYLWSTYQTKFSAKKFCLPGWYRLEKEDVKPFATMHQTLNPDASIDYVTQHVMSVFSCYDTAAGTLIRLRVCNKLINSVISVSLCNDHLQIIFNTNMNLDKISNFEIASAWSSKITISVSFIIDLH